MRKQKSLFRLPLCAFAAITLVTTLSLYGQSDFRRYQKKEAAAKAAFDAGKSVGSTQIMSRENIADAFKQFEKTGDPKYAKRIYSEYSFFKNKRISFMSNNGVSAAQIKKLDNWKRAQLEKACNTIAKKYNGEFILHRPGSSSKGAIGYIAGKSDDDIIPQMLKNNTKERLKAVVRDIKGEFRRLTGAKAESLDINFLTRDKPLNYDARMRLGANPEKYTTQGGDRMLDQWLNNKGSTMVWDPKKGEMVEHLFRKINPAVPPLQGKHAFGYASDNIRQMKINILNNPAMAPTTKLAKLDKYAQRNRDALQLAGESLTPAQESLMKRSSTLIREMKTAAANNVKLNPNVMTRVNRAIKDIERMNHNVFQSLHCDYLKRISGKLMLADNKIICDMTRELAGSYQNYVGHLPRSEQVNALKKLLNAVPKATHNTAYKAIYTAIHQQGDLNAAISHIKDMQLESFQNIVKAQVESRKFIKTKSFSPNPKADMKVKDPYFQSAKSKGLVKGAQAISKIPENGWMVSAETVDDALKNWKPGRLKELCDKGILTQTDKKEVLRKVRKLASAHLEEEIAQSWRNQHKQYKKFSKTSQQRVKSTQMVYNKMTLPSAKGILFRNAIFTGGITFTIYAVKACYDGPYAAIEELIKAAPTIAWETVKVSAFEYVCVNVLPSAGYPILGAAMWEGVMYGSLAQMAIAGLMYAECWFGDKMFTYIYDEPVMKSLYTLFFDYLETNQVDLGKKIGRNRKKLYPAFETYPALVKEMDSFWDSSYYYEVKGPHFGQARGTFTNWCKQVRSDWLTAGGKKAMEAAEKYRYEDAKNTRLEKILLSGDREGKSTVGILYANISDDELQEDDEFEADITYMVIGIPGRKTRVELIASLIAPEGKVEQTQHLKMYHQFAPDDIRPESIIIRNKLTAKFKLPGPPDKYQIKVVCTSKPDDILLMPITKQLNKVRARIYKQVGEHKTSMPIKDASVTLEGTNNKYELLQVEDGVYEIANAAPGSYNMTASAPGFTAEDGSERVSSKIELEKVPKYLQATTIEKTIYLAQITHSVTVIVTDQESGEPIPSSRVLFDGDEFPVNPQGKYILKNLTDGKYKFNAAAEGYKTPATPVAVLIDIKKEAITQVIQIQLKRILCTFIPEIKDQQGNAIENATISISTDEQKKTNKRGITRFEKIPYGKAVTVTAEKPGFLKFQENIKILPNDKEQSEMKKTIILQPKSVIEISMSKLILDPATISPNNGNGKADAGEQITLPITITNKGVSPSETALLSVSCESPLVSIDNTRIRPCKILAPGAKETINVTARISKFVTKREVVTITALLTAQSDKANTTRANFTITLNPLSPLQFELTQVPRIKDPDSGELAGKNNGNNILGAGETGYIYLKIKNNGSDAKDVRFELQSTPTKALQGNIQEMSPLGADFTLKENETIERMFQITLPADYSTDTLSLILKASSGTMRWEKRFSIPIEMKNIFSAECTLLNSEGKPALTKDRIKGATLGSKIKITCDSKLDTDGLTIVIRSSKDRINVVVPYEFNKQSITPDNPWLRNGKIQIPDEFSHDSFYLEVEIQDEARGNRVIFKKSFPFAVSAEDLLEHITYWDNGKQKSYYTYYISQETEAKVQHGISKWFWENGKIHGECTNEHGKREGRYRSWRDDGQRGEDSTYKNGLLHGHYISWLISGKKKGKRNSEGNYINGQKDGKWFSELGKGRQEYHYKNGKKHGLTTSWDEDGRKQFTTNYQNGKRHGLQTSWHKLGKTKWREVMYKDDLIHGSQITWNSAGTKIQEEAYLDGKKNGKSRYWYENGNIKSEMDYKNDRNHGVYKTWYENGKQIEVSSYDNGQKDGAYATWYKNGNKKASGSYKKGKQDGQFTNWSEGGGLESEATYKDGKMDGTYTSYYQTGIKCEQIQYVNDARNGKYQRWHRNGQLAASGSYSNGKLTGKLREWDEKGVEVKMVRITF